MQPQKELVIASNNAGKIREIRDILLGFHLLSLKDIGFDREIPEPHETFEENALEKAKVIHQFCQKDVLSDDSGICVAALSGQPGVHSAYFGGLPRSDEKNNATLLDRLSGVRSLEERSAFYKAVICLIWEGETYFFQGICEGYIAKEPRGDRGFGYDPLFVPKGYDQTFGELDADVKNRLSHRGKAVLEMAAFLNTR